MSALLTQLPNILLGLDMVDSLVARFQKVAGGMRQALSENRDLTPEELATYRADAEAEDVNLEAAIERARQREFLTHGGAVDNPTASDKVDPTGGGDIRP